MPLPERPKTMTFSLPSSSAFFASRIAMATAWLVSGATTMPSVRANITADSKHSSWGT
jgi:hypothetical protein